MKKNEPSKLREKQKRFCEEYIIDLNATQAAIRSGYSKKTSYSQSHDLLKKHEIQEYIKELRKEQQQRTGITADMVIEEIGKLAFGDIRNMYDEDGRMLQPHELSDEAAATISSFKVRHESTSGDDSPPDVIEEYRRYDKTKNLELLCRHFGLLNDKLKVEGEFNLSSFVKRRHDKNKK